MSPPANNLLHRQRKAPDVSFCKALQNSTWSFSVPLPQNSQVRFVVPFYALPVADEGSRLAAVVTQKMFDVSAALTQGTVPCVFLMY